MEEMIRIERLGYGSAGIGHSAQGKTVFVEGSAPGELALVAIEKDLKNYSLGRLLEVVEASPARRKAPCPAYRRCGGCPWQHLDYPAQLAGKRDALVSNLVHIAGFSQEAAEAAVAPCRPSKYEWGYRNKLELSACTNNDGAFVLGFPDKEGSQEAKGSAAAQGREGTAGNEAQGIAAIDSCMLVHKPIQSSPKALRGAIRYLCGKQDLGIFRVSVRSSLRSKDIEIALWTVPGAFPRKAAAQVLQGALDATSVVRVIAEPGAARRVKGVEALSGKGYWEERLFETTFQTSAPSFFQVNTAGAETLVEEVLAGLGLESGMRVADLYAGGGTFALALAGLGSTVLAVESAATSVRDLRRNVKRNNARVEVIGGDASRCLPELLPLDALVLDPPRSGLSPALVESIVSAGIGRLAYVSCDPATWARDASRLIAGGYELVRALPVDLFPQSYHIETVSIFQK